MPDFFTRYQKPVWITLVSAAVAVSAILTYLLFFREKPVPPNYQGDVRITLDIPAETSAGAEISIRADIENLSNSKLTELTLEIFYPQGFTFLNSTPRPAESGRGSPSEAGRLFALPDMSVGGSDHIVVIGRLSGSIAEVKTVSAKLRYVPENFRSTFLVSAAATTEIRPAELSLQLFAPTHLISGQSIAYRVELRNISSRDFTDLTAVFRYPGGFSGDEPEKNIGRIASGEAKVLEARGVLAAPANTEALVEVELWSRAEGEAISLARSFAFTEVEASPLRLVHEVSTEEKFVAIPAELRYKVFYENQSQTALNNVSISVVFSPLFAGLEVTSETGQMSGSSLLFVPGRNRELSVVGAGQKGEFQFIVKLTEAVVQKLVKNPTLTTRVEYRATEVSETLSGNTISLPVATELSLSAKATSFGVNVYEVELVVANTVNDVADATFTAIIPGADVVFEGDAEFSPSSGVLRWRLGQVFAFAGSFHEPRKLTFRLTTSDPELLRELVVTGRDEHAGAEISSNKVISLSSED